MHLTRTTADRYALVNAGHHFLLTFLPIHRTTSVSALAAFVTVAQRYSLAALELDAVLVRCLSVVDCSIATKRFPSLVDRYLCGGNGTTRSALDRFRGCLEECLRYWGVVDGAVQQAIQVIHAHSSSESCAPEFVARKVEQRLSTLCVKFKRETGRTLGEYIRHARLDQAALLLASTDKTIKEIWAAVGYNHASNFDHDFKKRFSVAPRDFRASCVRPVAKQHYRTAPVSSRPAPLDSRPFDDDHTVLILDDDGIAARLLSRHLRSDGFRVSVASNARDTLGDIVSARPNVILLDYRVPDRDGMNVLRSLRDNSIMRSTAFIFFISDWETFDIVSEAAALGAAVVSKLCDLDRISDVIRFMARRVSSQTPLDGNSAVVHAHANAQYQEPYVFRRQV